MPKPSAASILSVLLVLSWIGFLSTGPRAADDAKPEAKPEAKSAVQKWEYQRVVLQDRARIDAAGDEGWEGFAVGQLSEGQVQYLFCKRPKK